jgi:hypothetical protein
MEEKIPSGKYPNGSDVTILYPEIVKYWIGKGMPKKHIEVHSCPSVDEDCLYLYGRWFGYCRKPMEWKLWKDLTNEEKPPKSKIPDKYFK